MDVEVADADGGEARAEEGEVASCELYHVEPPGGDVGRAGVDLYGIDGQDLTGDGVVEVEVEVVRSGASRFDRHLQRGVVGGHGGGEGPVDCRAARRLVDEHGCDGQDHGCDEHLPRSEEHTSELQSLMRISYAVFCLKKKKNNIQNES